MVIAQKMHAIVAEIRSLSSDGRALRKCDALDVLIRESQASRAAQPLDTRFRDAFRLLYTDIEDFVKLGSLGSHAEDLGWHRLKQFGALFEEAMRPDPPAAVPQAAESESK